MPVTQLDGRFRTARIRLANRTLRALQVLWASQVDSPGDRETQQAFAARAAQIVGAAQRQQAQATAAYQAAKAREAGVDPAAQIDPDRYTNLRGIDPEEVYRRPFGAAGQQLGQGAAFARALSSGRARLTKLASTDLQMAHTYSSRDWMSSQDGVAGYRRVLGSGKSCGLCVTASTQRYRSSDLAPIHESCQCTMSPIYSDTEVGRVVDSDRLNAVKQRLEAEDQPYTREAMSRLRFDPDELPTVDLVQDAELGPRLLDRNWNHAVN